MKLIVFDTETTDLCPGQICQLAYLRVDGDQVAGKNMFFCVDSMSAGSQAVHGLSMRALRTLSGGQRFADRAQEIIADFGAAQLIVGHNVSFDMRFLRAELQRVGLELPAIPTFCTMKHFTPAMALKRKFQGGRPKPPKLVELAEFFALNDAEVERLSGAWFGGGGSSHDARFDAAMTFLCLREGARRDMVQPLS